MQTLYYLLKSSKLNKEYFTNLLKQILGIDRLILNSSQKLHINSLMHRERLRLWQTILTLLPKFNEADFDLLIDHADENLFTESQPSNRILMEWVIIRVIYAKIKSFDLSSFLKKVENVSRIFFLCSSLEFYSKCMNLSLIIKKLDTLALGCLYSPN